MRISPGSFTCRPLPDSGLTKDSGADAFQVKSLAEARFLGKLGELNATQLEQIAAAVAACIGAP